MTTVHDARYAVLRSLGMTTLFGNPGSNELLFLDRFPCDFRYILGLREGAALALADGYSQATGRPGFSCRYTRCDENFVLVAAV